MHLWYKCVYSPFSYEYTSVKCTINRRVTVWYGIDDIAVNMNRLSESLIDAYLLINIIYYAKQRIFEFIIDSSPNYRNRKSLFIIRAA